MSRPLSFRVVSALLAVWLAIVLAEPAALHVCPAHDGMAAESGGHGAHVHHDAEDSGVPAQCACLGHCAGASSPGLPSIAAGVPAPAWVIASAAVAVDFDFAAPPVPHLLPFANGPPVLS